MTENRAYELSKAKEIAEEFIERIKNQCVKAEIVGSIRRGKPHVHDIDIVAIPKSGMFLFEFPCKMRGEKIVRLDYKGIEVDIYIANEDTYETLKLIRTGSVEHNIMMCRNAKSRGWRLKASGEGLITDNGIIKTERGILEALIGMYRKPEEREGQ